MEQDVILATEGITKAFPGVLALDRVDFSVKRGEVHVLLGENGAGKSTLMKILSGAYRRDAGKIFIGGREVDILNPRHAHTLGIGIVYQEPALVRSLSVAENVFLGSEPTRGRLRLIDWGQLYCKAQELFKEIGMEVDPRRLVRSLSTAEQQLTGIARALSFKVDVLILDEPTSALSEREAKELFRIIRHLKSRGVAIIYISHKLDELFEIGDRVTVLRDGRKIGTLAVQGADRPTLTKTLVTMMVGRELREQFPKRFVEPGKTVLRVEGLVPKGSAHEVSFYARQGEIVGIYGLVGSGRTELLRAVYGADPRRSGKIYIHDKETRYQSPRGAIKAGVGFVPEDRRKEGLMPPRSVKENITIASIRKLCTMGVIRGREEAQAAANYVKILNIKTQGLGQAVKYLSGGNQQKVVLARWLCNKSRVFIFDEPTRGIDIAAKAEVYELMNKLAEQGAAIVMVSSELPEITQMCDRVYVMRNGRIIAEFHRGEMTQEQIGACATGGECIGE